MKGAILSSLTLPPSSFRFRVRTFTRGRRVKTCTPGEKFFDAESGCYNPSVFLSLVFGA